MSVEVTSTCHQQSEREEGGARNSDGAPAIRSRDQLREEVFPTVIRRFEQLLYSRYFPYVKYCYIVLSIWSIASVAYGNWRFNSEHGQIFWIFFNMNMLFIILAPAVSVRMFCGALQCDYVHYVLFDSFHLNKNMKGYFTYIVHLNVFLYVFANVVFLMSVPKRASALGIATVINQVLLSVFFSIPYFIVVSFFVALTFALWSRVHNYLKKLVSLRHICDKRNQHMENLFPSFLSPPSHLTETSSPLRYSDIIGDVTTLNTKSNSFIKTIYKFYYQELSVCLNLSEECGEYLFVLFSLSLLNTSLYILAFYSDIYSAGIYYLLAYFAVTLIHLLQLCLVISYCNEDGHTASREMCNLLLSRCSQEKECCSEENKDIACLSGCVNQCKLEIRFFGNFALRSSLVFAVISSIIAAVLPALFKQQ